MAEPRRLMSRTVAVGGTLAALALIASCADVAEVVEVCASRTDPPIRVDDHVCEAPANRHESDGYGWYEIQLPPTEYDVDGYAIYHPIVIVDVGQPMPRHGQPGAGLYRGHTRSTTDPARIVRPPARAGTPGGTTVSRGGLGVTGSSSSSGG